MTMTKKETLGRCLLFVLAIICFMFGGAALVVDKGFTLSDFTLMMAFDCMVAFGVFLFLCVFSVDK